MILEVKGQSFCCTCSSVFENCCHVEKVDYSFGYKANMEICSITLSPVCHFYYTFSFKHWFYLMVCNHRKQKHLMLLVVHLVSASTSLNYRIIWLIRTTYYPLDSKLKKSNSPISEKDNWSDFAVNVTIIHSITQAWNPEIIFYSRHLSSPTQSHQVVMSFL